jgi:hypothetical protein
VAAVRRRWRTKTAVAVLLGLGSVTILDGPHAPASTLASATSCPTTPRADLAPRTGVLFGVNLDWSRDRLAGYAARLHHHPAVAVWFTDFPMSAADRGYFQQTVAQTRSQGAILLLTLQPTRGLAAVTDAAATDLAVTLAAANRSGVPVIVRFAHEMNGSWYPWGQQPHAYVAAFRRVAAAVHRLAPGSAMMWAPNYGGGYPFTGGRYAARPGTADYRALDTNHDGVVDQRDDPYAPYWPGDDAVDWVGLSLYHWGNRYPWGANVIPEPGKFIAQLTGTYDGAGGDDRAVPNFYAIYGVQHRKPLAIAETAALVNTSRNTSNELAIKQAWWRQVFAAAIPARFADLKMINWFEWDKYEVEVHARVDWTATVNPAVRAAFDRQLPRWLRFGIPSRPGCYTRPA